jgi:uncharacterized membrane protein
MKRPNIRFFLLICLVFTVTIFIFYNNSPLAKESNQNEITEANEILEKTHETKLAFQIEEALKKNGYSPYGGIGFQIYSSDKQYVTILMENIDPKNKDTHKNIQKIVDTVSKANNFNLFVVDIQKVNK